MKVNISTHLQGRSNIAKTITLQTHNVFSTLKQRRNVQRGIHVVCLWSNFC